MLNPKDVHQNDMLITRVRKWSLLLIVFIILFVWFGIRLVTTESPKEWKTVDITVADVRYVSTRFNRWHITDTKGNTYSAHEPKIVMNQILPQSTYRIVYSPDSQNGIRAITQGDTVIVDYAHSVAVHCERSVWDWLLAFLGMTGSLTMIVCMVMDVRKAIINK